MIAPNRTPSFDSHQTSAKRIMLIMANTLDCRVLSEFLRTNFPPELEIVESTDDFEFGISRCQRLVPKALILDPKCHSQALSESIDLLFQGFLSKVILLDDRPREGLLVDVLPLHQISYLTREMDGQDLIESIRRIVLHGERVFDPKVRERVARTHHGWRLNPQMTTNSVADLTTREKDVLKLLAEGFSVRDCAKRLAVSVSTVDNHKTRMMKKLKLHKATQLTRLAISEGFIWC